MDERQAFMLGFMRRCVEGGLTIPEIDQTLTKVAEGGWGSTLSSFLPPAAGTALGYGVAGAPGAVAGGLATSLPAATLPVLLGVTAAGGGALGYGAGAVMDSLDEQHPDELKMRDVANRYSVALRNLNLRRQIAEESRARAGRRAHWRA